jgi:mycoredoxin
MVSWHGGKEPFQAFKVSFCTDGLHFICAGLCVKFPRKSMKVLSEIEVIPMEGGLMNVEIVFYGTKWCPDCKRAKRFMDERNIEYRYVDIDKDHEARSYVMDVNNGNRSVPTIVFPDGEILVEPSNADLANKFDLGEME